MKITSNVIFVPIFWALIFGQALAQTNPPKFGKIEKEEFDELYCPIDSNAHAFFIYDFGKSEFKYNTTMEDKGFQLHFKRHCKIKIVDNQGFSWGDIRIPLYRSNSDKEEVFSIRGFSYNLVDGKIEKTKLDRKDIIYEETSENWETCKFAMPNLKAGTIIEIEYLAISDFLFNLQEWYFQRQIPVLQSNYEVTIPEYFNYNQTQFGYYPFSVSQKAKRGRITLTSRERTGNRIVKSTLHTNEIDFEEIVNYYEATNVPAFPDEKFVKTDENYLSKVDFELQYTKFPNQPLNYYTTSWEEIDNKLLNNDYFGRKLNDTGHLRDAITTLKESGIQNEELVNAALEHIQGKISWNNVRSKYVDTNLSKPYKNGEGNSADINLNLVALLRSLDINSFPVVLSTRDNGIIHPAHPSLSRFNYVIAMAEIDGNTYLLDATSPISSLNLIPPYCLNHNGRVIGNYPEKWIHLENYKPYTIKAIYQLSIDSSLALSGKVSKNFQDYGAFDYKSRLNEINDPQEFFSELEEKNTGFEVKNMEIQGLEGEQQKLSLAYEVLPKHKIEGAGEMLYFTPTLDPFFSENPFKLEKREYPVEFNYPHTFQNVYTYIIPTNLEITEIPEPMIVKLPEGNGSFHFQVHRAGQHLTINSVMKINKSIFSPLEYDALKKFFQFVIDKQNDVIVLKQL